MPDDKLGAKQRAVMFVLMAEARALSNPEMDDLCGLRLDGKERVRLNEMGLVDSTKQGRAFVHELTERGGQWCHDELTAGRPRGENASLVKAFYVVLANLRPYLDHAEVGLADLFHVESVEDRVRAAYDRLAGEPGDYVRLTELRRGLNGMPRDEVDDVLRELNRTRRAVLVSEDAQESLTQADRDAALRIGNQENHLIAIEPV
ncbi:MAG TPA: hypothetical protein VHH15_21270 [Actinophytocola sp.]|nr:hypothetical protein [Actinophytocola sp.]